MHIWAAVVAFFKAVAAAAPHLARWLERRANEAATRRREQDIAQTREDIEKLGKAVGGSDARAATRVLDELQKRDDANRVPPGK